MLLQRIRAGRPVEIVVRVALVGATFLLLAQLAPLSRGVDRWMDAAYETQRLSDAQAAYDHVLRLTGDHPVVYTRLVALSLDAGNTEATRVYLYALAERDGWTTARRDWLRDVLVAEGDTLGEMALLYVTTRDTGGDPAALRRLAEQQIARQDWVQAQITLAQLVERDPADAQAQYWLGVLLALDAPEDALHYLNRASANRLWRSQANVVLDALAIYAQTTPSNAHTYMGVTLIGLGEWAFAERAFDRALAVNAANPAALAYLGFVRDRQGRDGLPDLEAALAMAPNDPLVHYLLGQHWRIAGDDLAARDAFMRAYVLDDSNPAFAVEVAISFQNLSDYESAERWFQEAVTLEPDNVQWQRAQAAFYADTGFKLETTGFDVIQQIRARYPDDAGIAASLGWAYYQQNDIQQAYDELNRAVSLDSTSVRVRYYFGVVLEERGDSGGAADSYWYVVETADARSPYGVLAARALERLGQRSS